MSEHNPNLDPNLDSTAPDTAEMVEGVDYDRRDARSGLIAIVSASILGLLLVFIIGIYWLYVVAYEKVDQEVYSGAPSKELQAIHDREEQNLHSYGYIDKEKGIVRIPIERAMEIVAAETAEGKVSYNTKTYPVKQELPGGAAGGANPPAQPAGAPGAAPAAVTPAPAAEKAAH
ncbi:MAG: hypothetical protein HY821_08045 [Acidobacteria bacterium]|nr:hypothetical protein [Acidobacteriota bacterium]